MNSKEKYVKKIRKFSRFYAGLMDGLDRVFPSLGYSSLEARILFEINSAKKCSAKSLTEKLSIDKSYTSRLIASLETKDLIVREASPTDRRTLVIRLTPKGKSEVKALINSADEYIDRLAAGLGDSGCRKVCKAMEQIMECFEE